MLPHLFGFIISTFLFFFPFLIDNLTYYFWKWQDKKVCRELVFVVFYECDTDSYIPGNIVIQIEDSSSSDSREIMETINFPIKGIESLDEERFFSHFVNVMPHILTLPADQSDDPVLSVIVPMSLENTMILKAVLCMGVSHLINHLSPEDNEIERLVNEKQRLLQEAEHEQSTRFVALHTLEKGTAEKIAEYEALLTSYLLLYLYELSEGNGDKSWQQRLDSARGLVFNALEEHRQSQSENADGDGQGPSREELESLGVNQFIMQFFIYHDILGSVTVQRSKDSLVSSRPGDSSPSSRQDSREHMLGVHDGLLDFIARIAALRSDAATMLSGPVISQAVCIWQDIDNWKLPDRDSEFQSDLCDIYEAYIAACFIWLFSILYPDSLADDKVQTMVRRGLDSLSSIQMPGLQSFTLYPVFVIGTACIQQQDREVLDEQLDRIERLRRFRNVQLCSSVIKNTWAAYDAGEKQSWDWIRLMETQGVSVPVT